MKNKNSVVIAALAIIVLLSFVFTKLNNNHNLESRDKLNIITSFYPIYIATANIVEGMDNIVLSNLAQPQTGCLHDYQLTPQDMIKLETADIFIVNGGGMESFLGDIENKYPNMTIINASDGIDLLESVEHSHEHSDAQSEQLHDEKNAHAWVSITAYMKQIENIRNGLVQYDNTHKNQYDENSKNYIQKLGKLKETMHAALKDIKNKDIVIFHDSFAYLAQEFGLDVKHVVVMEADTSLSAAEIAEVVDEVKNNDVKALFTEAQYSDQIASSVAKETSAKVYILDSCVTGDMNKDAYMNAMNKNLEVLKEALK